MLVQGRVVPKHRSTHISNYQSNERESYMSMMKTSLTIIPMCPRERFPLYKSFSRLVLCCKKDWAILLHLIYFYYLLPFTNYLITKLSVTDNFSACREYLTENCLGSTLLLIERTTIDPLYLWVINRNCRMLQHGHRSNPITCPQIKLK